MALKDHERPTLSEGRVTSHDALLSALRTIPSRLQYFLGTVW
jgi:hypothetical protein